MTPRALTCSECGGALNFGFGFCPYCRAPLTWSNTIDLKAGELLAKIDVALATPDAGTPQKDGLRVLLERNTYRWRVVSSNVRNACVSVRGRADAAGEIGALVRWNAVGTSFHTGYNVRIYPALRSFCCERWIMGDTDKATAPVIDWTYSPNVLPPGSPNDVEVRFGDEVLQLLVNGVRVASALDATFGFGEVAWYAGSNDAPAEVVLESVTVRRVA